MSHRRSSAQNREATHPKRACLRESYIFSSSLVRCSMMARYLKLKSTGSQVGAFIHRQLSIFLGGIWQFPLQVLPFLENAEFFALASVLPGALSVRAKDHNKRHTCRPVITISLQHQKGTMYSHQHRTWQVRSETSIIPVTLPFTV